MDGIRDDTQDTRYRVVDIQPRIRGIEFREEFKTIEPRVLPSQALTRQRSAQRAQQPWTIQNQDIVTLVQAIGGWIEYPHSALLVLDAARGKQIVAELIGGVLQPAAEAVCWSLSAAASKDEVVTVAGILSSLAWQLYKLNPAKAARCLDGNIDHADETRMAELLRLIIVQLGDCYVIVEVDDIAGPLKDIDQLDRLALMLQTVVDQASGEGCKVKVLLACRGLSVRAAKGPVIGESAWRQVVVSLGPPVPVPVSRQRRGTKSLFQSPGWLSLYARVRKRP